MIRMEQIVISVIMCCLGKGKGCFKKEKNSNIDRIEGCFRATCNKTIDGNNKAAGVS